MMQFGYYYYDSPNSIIGPQPEEEVFEKAKNDLSIQVVQRHGNDGAWYIFDFEPDVED